jgi:CelD/BcsL family acetyltransferase involved in cellulose biosynthesis
MLRELNGGASAATVWERLDLDAASARDALDATLAALDAQSGSVTLFHDPAWLLEAEDRHASAVRVYVARAHDTVCAYAPFVVQPWRLRFRAGELTLFARAFERLHLNGGPIIAATGDGEAVVCALLARMRGELAPHQAVYFEGVAIGSDIERAVQSASTRGAYHVLEPSPRYDRCIARLPASFEAFMTALKKQTRQNLRNGRRKLEKHVAGTLRLEVCTRAEDVSSFVARAVAISRRTYQWNLLGLGLRDSAALERTLTAMARHGWTRCYLLECAGVATAFMIGYLYRGTYYYVDVGFDPEWESWSVGTVLHLDVMRDLIDGEAHAQAFDFSSGWGVHKSRFSNETRPEASYVLLPRTARNAFTVASYRAMEAATGTAERMVERLGLKGVAKRMLRRRATERASTD